MNIWLTSMSTAPCRRLPMAHTQRFPRRLENMAVHDEDVRDEREESTLSRLVKRALKQTTNT